jgi:hypothetical protein
MSWSIEYTDEFGEWWNELSENQQEDFTAIGIADGIWPPASLPVFVGHRRLEARSHA